MRLPSRESLTSSEVQLAVQAKMHRQEMKQARGDFIFIPGSALGSSAQLALWNLQLTLHCLLALIHFYSGLLHSPDVEHTRQTAARRHSPQKLSYHNRTQLSTITPCLFPPSASVVAGCRCQAVSEKCPNRHIGGKCGGPCCTPEAFPSSLLLQVSRLNIMNRSSKIYLHPTAQEPQKITLKETIDTVFCSAAPNSETFT